MDRIPVHKFTDFHFQLKIAFQKLLQELWFVTAYSVARAVIFSKILGESLAFFRLRLCQIGVKCGVHNVDKWFFVFFILFFCLFENEV
jgi:hypothetical protein